MDNLVDSKSKVINIVCNAGVSTERIRRRSGKEKYRQDLKVFAIHVFRSIVNIVLTLIIILLYFRLLYIFGMLFFLLSLPLFALLVRYARLHSSNYRLPPTNLLLDKEGIRVAWNYQTSRISKRLEWRDLELVNAFKLRSEQPGVSDGDLVTFKFEINNMGFEERLATKVQLKLLKPFFEREYVFKDLFSHRELVAKIPLDMFTLEADRMRFVAAINQWAPEEVFSDSFKSLANSTNAPTYTQLWLDDLQSFKRKRTEALDASTSLQEGKYVIRNKMTSGGQAQIYIADDIEHGRMVVLKEFVLPVSAGSEVRNRSFKNVKTEAILLSQLEHPGIVHLFDHFVEDHRAYLVLEYIEGDSIRQSVSNGSVVRGEDLKNYIIQLCEILVYLHESTPPLVHRDFTPANLVFTASKRIKLIDFNVAHHMESNTTKTVVGKHCYMAPEQFKGKPCPQSDLYSLGCTLYFMVMGKDPVPLSQSEIDDVPDIDPCIKELVKSLTCKKVDDRISSAKEVLKLVNASS